MREIATLIPIAFFDPKAWIITGEIIPGALHERSAPLATLQDIPYNVNITLGKDLLKDILISSSIIS